MDYLQATMKGMKVEGSEMMVPLLRGFYSGIDNTDIRYDDD